MLRKKCCLFREHFCACVHKGRTGLHPPPEVFCRAVLHGGSIANTAGLKSLPHPCYQRINIHILVYTYSRVILLVLRVDAPSLLDAVLEFPPWLLDTLFTYSRSGLERQNSSRILPSLSLLPTVSLLSPLTAAGSLPPHFTSWSVLLSTLLFVVAYEQVKKGA